MSETTIPTVQAVLSESRRLKEATERLTAQARELSEAIAEALGLPKEKEPDKKPVTSTDLRR